jgi:hypothetical protein
VVGYRAPSYSITRSSLWALDVLADAGFEYDSSIFPIRHDVYGIPDAPRGPFRVDDRVRAAARISDHHVPARRKHQLSRGRRRISSPASILVHEIRLTRAHVGSSFR